MTSPSGPSHSCALPPGSEPCSPLSPTMPTTEPSDRKRGATLAVASGEAAAQLEPRSLLFSCHSTGAASARMLDPSASTQNVQRTRFFRFDGAKHKIFLSHSGAQKDFVEQLCVDLERRGYLFLFFDQRCLILPGGKDFAPLIMEAARLCHVAVIVLSEELLSSKWPMIELAEFHAAQQAAGEGCNKGGGLQRVCCAEHF